MIFNYDFAKLQFFLRWNK